MLIIIYKAKPFLLEVSSLGTSFVQLKVAADIFDNSLVKFLMHYAIKTTFPRITKIAGKLAILRCCKNHSF
jgi:hypothetical protein